MSPSDAPIQVGELCEGVGYSGTTRRGEYRRTEGADALLERDDGGTWRIQLATLKRLPREPETPPLFETGCCLCGGTGGDMGELCGTRANAGARYHIECRNERFGDAGGNDRLDAELTRRKSHLSRPEPERFSPGDWVVGESSEDKTLGVSMRGKFVRRCDDSLPSDSVIDIGNGEVNHHYVRTSTLRRAGDPTPAKLAVGDRVRGKYGSLATVRSVHGEQVRVTWEGCGDVVGCLHDMDGFEKLAPASSGESPRVSTVSDATARVVPNETPSGHSQPSPPEPSTWGIPRELEPLDLRDLAAADERFVTKLENMTDSSSRYGNLANSDDPLDRLAASRLSRRECEGEVASEDKRDPWDWDADDADELYAMS